jgi:hypothetical protein
MKLLSVHILALFACLWLWLSGGLPDPCQAQVRLTNSGRPQATAMPSVRLLKLPLTQKIDSILHHIRTYSQTPANQQERYARELTAYFAPSGYISVHQDGQPDARLSVNDYLAQFGNRSAAVQFKGAEVVYYGQSIKTAAGDWQTMVTTYRNATTFTGNKPQASDIATVMTPVGTAPLTTNYWQIFTLYLTIPKAGSNRQ